MTANQTTDGSAAAPPARSRSILYASIAVGLVMALLVVLLLTRKDAESRTSASPVVGHSAPALNGKPIVGQHVDIGSNDRWMLVNFFATWCTPCVQEHPQLRKLAKDTADSGEAKVVSVVYGDKPSAVRSFFKRHGGSWTVLDSDDGRTALDWGVAKVPESFLVSPTGIVVERYQGGVTAADVEGAIAAYEKAAGEGGP